MKKIGLSILWLALLSACATTNKPAVEERSIDMATPSSATTDSNAGDAGNATNAVPPHATPLNPLQATPLNPLQATSGNPLQDPASILSRRSVYFPYDSFAVANEYQSLVEAHAKYLASNPQAKVALEGHADERGSREYNLALGQKRAESVRKVMSLLGVPDHQLEAVSFGEEKPQALGDNEEAWKQNRRTDIRYQGE